MKAENSKILKIRLKDGDVDVFKSAIKKMINKEVGFNSSGLEDDEHKLIKRLSDKLNEEE